MNSIQVLVFATVLEFTLGNFQPALIDQTLTAAISGTVITTPSSCEFFFGLFIIL